MASLLKGQMTLPKRHSPSPPTGLDLSSLGARDGGLLALLLLLPPVSEAPFDSSSVTEFLLLRDRDLSRLTKLDIELSLPLRPRRHHLEEPSSAEGGSADEPRDASEVSVVAMVGFIMLARLLAGKQRRISSGVDDKRILDSVCRNLQNDAEKMTGIVLHYSIAWRLTLNSR
ncbi:hypothetical protein B0T20DRAFT_393371 [Sordaria brevicollis]|uniref:Uncharacterized protein n=1 Tax=Sordaria brevicollis TaxID=83679 RepID=A0AAE0UBE2_SORBR|nr:hypothetical protein B0T20DRAFT_393371 [Sordaria brevicollis]